MSKKTVYMCFSTDMVHSGHIEIIKKAGIKAVFTEPQYSPGAANTISKETGAKIYTLDPVVTGEANDGAKNAYIETMQKNAATLVKALQ